MTLLDLAAGLAVTAAAAVPVAAQTPLVPNWTGFYIGAHGGSRTAHANFTGNSYTFDADGPGGFPAVVIPARNEFYNLRSGIFGTQFGYNFQFAPNFLVGFESNVTWGHGSDTIGSTFGAIVGFGDGSTFYTLNRVSEAVLSWQTSFRARAGVVAGPVLFYGTGGVAFAHVKWSENSTFTPSSGPVVTSSLTASKTLPGWVGGGGIEYLFANHWIVRVEYLYENFGNFSVPHGFGPQTGNLDLSGVQSITFGLSYKFGGPL